MDGTGSRGEQAFRGNQTVNWTDPVWFGSVDSFHIFENFELNWTKFWFGSVLISVQKIRLTEFTNFFIFKYYNNVIKKFNIFKNFGRFDFDFENFS